VAGRSGVLAASALSGLALAVARELKDVRLQRETTDEESSRWCRCVIGRTTMRLR
jgi:hypothetical protein